MTYTFHLQQGVKFQNGKDFKAEDVVYSLNRFRNPATSVWASSLDAVSKVEATDDYTVLITTKVPYAPLLDKLAYFTCVMYPKDTVPTATSMIGTGPFQLDSLVANTTLTLVRNPNYWGYDERHPQNQLPYIDTLKVLVIPDQATALAALRTGKIDDVNALTAKQVQTLKTTNPNLVPISVLPSQAVTVDPRNDTAPFNDIRVRQAMQEAIDLPTLAKTYYGGSVDPWPSTLMSNYMTGWGYPYSQWPQSLKDKYAYNPTAAKQLLAAAGYPNGFKTDCIADNSADLDLLQIVQSYFTAIGINMTVTTLDPASFSSYVQMGHKQDAIAYRNGGALANGYDFFTMLGRFMTKTGYNYSMTADPVYDAFYATAMATTSTDQMKQVMSDACKYVAEHFFAVSLLQVPNYTLCQPWLKGGYNGQSMSLSNAGIMYGFYTARFWIDQNLKKSMGY